MSRVQWFVLLAIGLVGAGAIFLIGRAAAQAGRPITDPRIAEALARQLPASISNRLRVELTDLSGVYSPLGGGTTASG